MVNFTSCKIVYSGFISQKKLDYYHVSDIKDYISVDTDFYARTYPILDHEDVYLNIEDDETIKALLSSLLLYFSDSSKFSYCGYPDNYYNANVFRSKNLSDYFYVLKNGYHEANFIYKAIDNDTIYRLRVFSNHKTIRGKSYNFCLRLDRPYNFVLSEEYKISDRYATACPEYFEYNGRLYHKVKGDELNVTDTQEELGELLGYIIREEDISSFIQEYPSVDYIIDNGIYDYETNNRVALYSLNSYPDFSIICMHQLGNYILYHCEGEKDLQFEIRDKAKEENLPCDTALEKFYEDESNEYYFYVIKSQYIVVIYNDGTSENIVTALNAGLVTIDDLDEFGIEYHVKPKK